MNAEPTAEIELTARMPRTCPTCGRMGSCADCCCASPDHRSQWPQRPAACSLCGHPTTAPPGAIAAQTSINRMLGNLASIGAWPRRDAAVTALAARGEPERHVTHPHTAYAHGHPGACCCWTQACRSDLCNVNAQIVADLYRPGGSDE